jgi:hypothetical protein
VRAVLRNNAATTKSHSGVRKSACGFAQKRRDKQKP